MTTLLHIDASARPGASDTTPHGSHTRRLSARFVEQWITRHPDTNVIYRDVGQQPPPLSPVAGYMRRSPRSRTPGLDARGIAHQRHADRRTA